MVLEIVDKQLLWDACLAQAVLKAMALTHWPLALIIGYGHACTEWDLAVYVR
ncbi:MAG: hypothetical protein P8M25_18165 [Paracoccaceae bacterium]|jgi:hypothetical protein|nr:hypothetical protein [Paracoccaceae bacterium]